MKTTVLPTLVLAIGLISPLTAQVEIKDTKGKHLDVLAHGKVLVRYMYEHDTSSKERQHETYKPYLHVFDAEGKKPITKGPGGKFTHHRGIFIGWNRLQFNGKSYDRWHMKSGDIVHQKFLKQEAGGHGGSFTSLTQWNDNDEKPLLDEERTMTVQAVHGGNVRMVIDFQSKLTATYGDVFLKGDPEHAGIQYRPANEVDAKKTKYTFPAEGTNVKNERDLPWIAETYVLDGKAYSVVQMNHPGNPKGTKHSAYRDYGRFGSFFEKEIKKGESLTVNYQFVIADGELPERKKIEQAWKAYAARK
ncbi:MAG: PmoA family protein [Roseibacillus sp.]